MPEFRGGKPRFRATRDTGLAAFPAGFNNLSLPTVDYDDEGGWDGTGYTLDRDGFWMLSIAALWTGTVSSAQRPLVRWSINGVGSDRVGSCAVTGDAGVFGLWRLELVAGDVLVPQGQRHTTSAAATLSGGTTWAEVSRIGPKRWT